MEQGIKPAVEELKLKLSAQHLCDDTPAHTSCSAAASARASLMVQLGTDGRQATAASQGQS